jgi:hypothetical protein
VGTRKKFLTLGRIKTRILGTGTCMNNYPQIREYALFLWAVLSIVGLGPRSNTDAYKRILPTLILVCTFKGNTKIHWRATWCVVTHLVAILITGDATL